MDGHKISAETIEAAKKHARQIAEHGRALEKMGASLHQDKQFTVEQSQMIKDAGQRIQKHAQAALAFVEAAEQDGQHSTEAFVLAGQEHAEAVRLHTEVNKIFLHPD